MTIQEWNNRHERSLDPVVLFAGQYLEARGMRFLQEFNTPTAVTKATEWYIDWLEVRYRVW